MRKRLLSFGARLGNWNDRWFGERHDARADRPCIWHVLDAAAGRLCVLGDR
jgi:hypothetical protein